MTGTAAPTTETIARDELVSVAPAPQARSGMEPTQ